MGKLPRWMVIEDTSKETGKATIVIWIRRWHPSFWLFYWRTAIRSYFEHRPPLWVWMRVALTQFFMPRRYEGTSDE